MFHMRKLLVIGCLEMILNLADLNLKPIVPMQFARAIDLFISNHQALETDGTASSVVPASAPLLMDRTADANENDMTPSGRSLDEFRAITNCTGSDIHNACAHAKLIGIHASS
jgi:hypothetical protein